MTEAGNYIQRAGWDPDHTRYEKGLWMESPDSTVDDEWSDSWW